MNVSATSYLPQIRAQFGENIADYLTRGVDYGAIKDESFLITIAGAMYSELDQKNKTPNYINGLLALEKDPSLTSAQRTQLGEALTAYGFGTEENK